MRTIDADKLKKALIEQMNFEEICRDSVFDIIDNAPTVDKIDEYVEAFKKGMSEIDDKRPQGEWIITAEDSEGIYRIQCPFCGYEKGSDFIDYIVVIFEKFPPFCESCGAKLRGKEE